MPGANPYGRLLNSETAKTPAYETEPRLASVVREVPPEVANPDIAAASPGQAKGSSADLSRVMTVDLAGTAHLPVSELAEVPALAERGGDTVVVLDSLAPAVSVAPAPMIQPQILGAANFVPPAPLMPVRDRLSDPFGTSVTDVPPTPFTAPEPPAQPRVAATELTEAALDLQRRQRIEVQRRLALAGFDPQGADGVFGPDTRSAIADFQASWGFPPTGYLEDAVYADLNQRTEAAYRAMLQRAAARRNAAPELASAQPAERPDRDGKCARGADGRIIERQNLGCDIAGMAEGFVSMNRSSLDSEDGPGASAAGDLPRPGPRGDR